MVLYFDAVLCYNNTMAEAVSNNAQSNNLDAGIGEALQAEAGPGALESIDPGDLMSQAEDEGDSKADKAMSKFTGGNVSSVEVHDEEEAAHDQNKVNKMIDQLMKGERKEIKLTPEQTAKLEYAQTLNHFMDLVEKNPSLLNDAVQRDYGVEGDRTIMVLARKEAKKMNTNFKKDYPAIVRELATNPNAQTTTVFNQYKGLITTFGIPIDVKDKEGYQEAANKMVTVMRENHSVDAAEQILNVALRDEFDRYDTPSVFTETIKKQLEKEAGDSADAIRAKYEAKWTEQGMTPAQIEKAKDGFKAMEYETLRSRYIAKNFMPRDGVGLDMGGAKGELWHQYNDMLDPKDENFNVTDENWEKIKTEIAVNIALYTVTGGVGMLVRAGVSAAARMAAIRFFGEMGVNAIAENVAGRFAMSAGGFIIQESVSLASAQSWKNQPIYKDLPTFATNLMFSFLGAGIVKGGQAIFPKVIPGLAHAGHAAHDVGGAIAHAADSIRNDSVKHLVHDLVEHGEVDAGAIMLLAAMREGQVAATTESRQIVNILTHEFAERGKHVAREVPEIYGEKKLHEELHHAAAGHDEAGHGSGGRGAPEGGHGKTDDHDNKVVDHGAPVENGPPVAEQNSEHEPHAENTVKHNPKT